MMAVNDDDHNLQFFMIGEWGGWSSTQDGVSSTRACALCPSVSSMTDSNVTPKTDGFEIIIIYLVHVLCP